MKKNLILSDIDGTFLDDNSSDIPANRSAVERFKKNGGLFTFSSGRSEITMRSIISDPQKIVNAPCILANGSYIYDYKTCERLYDTPLNGGLAANALREVSRLLPGVYITVYRFDSFLTYDKAENISPGLRGYLGENSVYTFDEMPLDGWSKAVMSGKEDDLARARELIETNFKDKFHICFSWPTLMEMLDPQANKGAKVKKLREYYAGMGIELKIYAIGDYENDIQMLEEADIAVCPSNAIDSVKKICDFAVCDNNKGAVSELIHRIEEERNN